MQYTQWIKQSFWVVHGLGWQKEMHKLRDWLFENKKTICEHRPCSILLIQSHLNELGKKKKQRRGKMKDKQERVATNIMTTCDAHHSIAFQVLNSVFLPFKQNVLSTNNSNGATITSTTTTIVHFVHVWVLSSSSAFSMRPQLIESKDQRLMWSSIWCSSTTQRNISLCIAYVCNQCIHNIQAAEKNCSGIHIHSLKPMNDERQPKRRTKIIETYVKHWQRCSSYLFDRMNLSTYVFQHLWVSVLSA